MWLQCVIDYLHESICILTGATRHVSAFIAWSVMKGISSYQITDKLNDLLSWCTEQVSALTVDLKYVGLLMGVRVWYDPLYSTRWACGSLLASPASLMTAFLQAGRQFVGHFRTGTWSLYTSSMDSFCSDECHWFMYICQCHTWLKSYYLA